MDPSGKPKLSSTVEARIAEIASRGKKKRDKQQQAKRKRDDDDAPPASTAPPAPTPNEAANTSSTTTATSAANALPTVFADTSALDDEIRAASPAPATPDCRDRDRDPSLPNASSQPRDKAGDDKARRRSRRRDADNFNTGPTVPTCTLNDIGGVSDVLAQLNELVGFPLAHPELFKFLGTEPISGILLHGPPGTGKTKLCHGLAHELSVPFFALNAPEVISGVSGDSEARLRSLFQEATAAAPSLILLDEIDAIAGKRDDAGKAMEARIVAQLQTCMDELANVWKRQGKAVIVLGATNRPEVIEPALRRSGRFDREIGLGIPTLKGRVEILKILTRSLRMSPEVDLNELAFLTPGFVGSDLHAMVKESALMCMKDVRSHVLTLQKEQQVEGEPAPTEPEVEGAVRRVPIPVGLDLEPIAMVMPSHFKLGASRVQPSSMREGFSTIPDVTWDDVGALEDVRREMDLWVQKSILYPSLYKRMGLGQPAGLLLFGPPGCGKTLVAKAIAHEASANFISVKGPELLNKFVGESERAVRMVFSRAKASSPCILFFDELDALAPKRGMDRSTPGAERLVNQLLTEMDGVEGRSGVYVIAATNRVDMIDPAMIRPGRFDKVLYVSLPSDAQRLSILQTLCRKTPCASSVNLELISNDPRCKGFSGADLKGLVREASMSAVRKVFDSGSPTDASSTAEVEVSDFEKALTITKASVSEKDRSHYDLLWLHQQSKQPTDDKKERGVKKLRK